MLQFWRPALIAARALEIEMEGFKRTVKPTKAAAHCLGPVLEWLSRATSSSALGQRLYAVVYVVRNSLINGATMQGIGKHSNKTRQAICKLIQDLRDTTGGQKCRPMRSEKTRALCQLAQLKPNRSL
jgi:hypothetical protein